MSFQSLPLHIIKIAVSYLVEPYSPVFKKGGVTALGLLHCCHSWRVVYMSTAFRTLLFEFCRFHAPRFRFKNCPDFINPLDYMTDTPVREFKVDCGDWDYSSYGDLSTWIEQSGYADLDFSLVRSLLIVYPITLMYTESFRPDDVTTAQCISQFLGRINCMFPALSTLELDRFTISGFEENADLSKLVADQVLNMINGVTSLSFGLSSEFEYLLYGSISDITGLSSFECSLHDNSVCPIDIIRRSAKTLRCLKINDLPRHLAHNLLYTDDNDEPTIFLSLEALYLYPTTSNNPQLLAGVPGMPLVLSDHFPELKKLVIAGSYPFRNNVVACLPAKMEYLHICLPTTPAALAMYHLSSPGIFPNLKHVTIHDVVIREQSEDSLLNRRDTDFIQIVKSICCSASYLHRLELSYPVSKSMLFDDLVASPIFTNLHFLNIDQIKLGFPDFVMLLQTAPSLQTLECSLDETLPKVAGVRPTDLPEYIYSALFPLSSFFVKLRVKWATPKAVDFHIRTVVLLAMTCPRFSEIEFPIDSPARTFSMIQKLLRTKSYQKHTHLVEPLLFKLRAKAIRMGYDME